MSVNKVSVTPGHVIQVREDISVAEAMKLGQADLDRCDAERGMTVTVGGKRFPSYVSNPNTAALWEQTKKDIAAQYDAALVGKTQMVVDIGTPTKVVRKFFYFTRKPFRLVINEGGRGFTFTCLPKCRFRIYLAGWVLMYNQKRWSFKRF